MAPATTPLIDMDGRFWRPEKDGGFTSWITISGLTLTETLDAVELAHERHAELREQRRRADRMNFGQRRACVTALVGPQIKIARQSPIVGQLKVPVDDARVSDVFETIALMSRHKATCETGDNFRTGNTNDRPHRPLGSCCQSDNRVVQMIRHC